MFARVSTYEGSSDHTAKGLRVAQEQILPAAKLMDGFKGIYLLYNRESGKSLSVTLWETEVDMRANEEAANRVRAQSAEASGDKVINVERYEVALQMLVD
jgi:heme-degrading monooxygenase HmoA